MTPERGKWWDSLPAEEKEIRKIIKRSKHQIHSYKQEMTTVLTDCKKNGWPISSITEKIFDSYKREMRTAKAFVKYMRKQLAMDFIVKSNFGTVYICPTCGEEMDWRTAYNKRCYCPCCGQKLRW